MKMGGHHIDVFRVPPCGVLLARAMGRCLDAWMGILRTLMLYGEEETEMI